MNAASVATQEHEDLAPVMADLLAQACKSYSSFCSDVITVRPLPWQEEEVCALIRANGARWATFLAYVAQMAAKSVVDLAGRPFPPPEGVTKPLSELQNNYTFIAGIENWDDLLAQPLVPWTDIRAEMDTPESREWMRAALAAY